MQAVLKERRGGPKFVSYVSDSALVDIRARKQKVQTSPQVDDLLCNQNGVRRWLETWAVLRGVDQQGNNTFRRERDRLRQKFLPAELAAPGISQ
jgi:hypothetical protein